MRQYSAHSLEFTKQGWTRLDIVTKADLSVGFSNKQIALTALADGDVVMGAFIHVRTAVTGPTGAPTAQVLVGAGGTAITPTVAVASAKYAVTNNAVVGQVTATTAVNLVLDLQAGAGDGAAATAGEIWVWSRISRASDRDISA